jgi:hypothetical protein
MPRDRCEWQSVTEVSHASFAATGASQFEFLEALTGAPAEHSAPAEKRRKCPHTIHPSVLDRVSEKVNTLFVAYFTSRVLRFRRCRFSG